MGMNKSLSLSFRNAFGNEYDDLIAERVKDVIPKDQKEKIWENWNVEFMGTIKMFQGNDETAILSKSEIVIKKLKNSKVSGKLTLSMLPKFGSKDLRPICDEILVRGRNMTYYPILRLNLMGTRW